MGIKAYREINKNPSRRDLIKLAVMFVVGFGALGAYQTFLNHHVEAGHSLFVAAGVLGVLALVPKVGRIVYIAWMGLGITMGLFTQPIILFVAYVVFFVPIALIFKVIGRDLMKRKLAAKTETYWEDYKESKDPSSYFQQH